MTLRKPHYYSGFQQFREILLFSVASGVLLCAQGLGILQLVLLPVTLLPCCQVLVGVLGSSGDSPCPNGTVASPQWSLAGSVSQRIVLKRRVRGPIQWISNSYWLPVSTLWRNVEPTGTKLPCWEYSLGVVCRTVPASFAWRSL